MLIRKGYVVCHDIFGDAVGACDELTTYGGTDIWDGVYEVADRFTPVYYSDLYPNCAELSEYVDEAIENGGIDRIMSIEDMLTQGAYQFYVNVLENTLNEIRFNIAYDYIAEKYKEYINKLGFSEVESITDGEDDIEYIKEQIDELIANR